MEDFRMALVLLRERSLGDDSAWAPYIAQLPAGYDLLGCWTDDQLEELQCERLQDAARAQRAENNAAFDAVRMNVSAYDSDYDLGLGALTKEADRVAVRRLTEEARKDVVELKVGWVGEYRGAGVGRGKYVYDDGDVHEGEFKDGQLHGHGKQVCSDGDVYEGQWKEGEYHGHGVPVGPKVVG